MVIYVWGIELVVMGDRITEHLKRFAGPNGKYFRFPSLIMSLSIFVEV
jgi:hypothetical protein